VAIEREHALNSVRSEAVCPSPVPQPFTVDRDYDAGVEPREHSGPARELAMPRGAPEEARAERVVVPRQRRVENHGAARSRHKTAGVEIDDPRAFRDRREVRGVDGAVGRIVHESRAFLRHDEISASRRRRSGKRGGRSDDQRYQHHGCCPESGIQPQSLHLLSPFVPTLNAAENATTKAAPSHLR
jgi:hypothetical protein